MDPKKKFGLVIPQKRAKNIKTKSIFESDSEEDISVTKRPKIPQKKLDLKSKIKEESLEDPSIYEYDSIYDDMKAKQAETIAPKEKKNSRYIETLLKAADKRKKEHERRIEKKIQVEREKEGDKFKDKESFVTSSYKKKMQEREEEEERERQENMLNDMMDVTKQKDLSGFYRHFLNQTIGEEKIPMFDDKHKKIEIVRIKEEDSVVGYSDSVASHKDNHNMNKQVKERTINIKEEEDSSAECSYDVASDKVNDNNNLDRDSDGIEIDNDSDSQTSESNKCTSGKICSTEHSALKIKDKSGDEEESCTSDKVKSKTFISKKNNKYRQKSDKTESESSSSDDCDENISNHTDKQGAFDKYKENNVDKRKHTKHNSSSDSSQDWSKISITPDETPKQSNPSKSGDHERQNIFVKRTIGDVFAEAQARYFQRMSKKSISIS